MLEWFAVDIRWGAIAGDTATYGSRTQKSEARNSLCQKWKVICFDQSSVLSRA